MGGQLRSDATRQAITDAAVQLFAEAGYGNVTLSEVIARAGVTKGSLYYHFATKEALAKALIERAYAGLVDALPEVPARDSGSGAALENLIRATFAMADLTQRDMEIQIGLQLDHGLRQINHGGRANFGDTRAVFAVLLERAVAVRARLGVFGVGTVALRPSQACADAHRALPAGAQAMTAQAQAGALVAGCAGQRDHAAMVHKG